MPPKKIKTAKNDMKTKNKEMRMEIADMEQRQARLRAELAQLGMDAKDNKEQQEHDNAAVNLDTRHKGQQSTPARAMTAQAATKREHAGDDKCSTGQVSLMTPGGGFPRGNVNDERHNQHSAAKAETTNTTDTRAMIAKATQKRACASDDKRNRSHVDIKPSGNSQWGSASELSRRKGTTTTEMTVGRRKPRSAIQGKPETVPDQPHVIPPTTDSIPKRKQQDAIELAVIQVMKEHSLMVIPTQKSYRSMFDELVEIKTKKLVKSRIQRVKRRENRQKKH